jgi:hypothetical protein
MAKFKHIILAIAISIVFALFVGFGIATFYNEPKYEDYCDEKFYERSYPVPIKEGGADCKFLEPDEELEAQCKDKGDVSPNYDENGCVESYSCETCGKEFRDTNEKYSRNVFIIATGLGIIALIIGFALKIPSVSSGLMGGGILTIIYGTLRYWGDLPDYGRFIILGIALAILIWMGYKKISK